MRVNELRIGKSLGGIVESLLKIPDLLYQLLIGDALADGTVARLQIKWFDRVRRETTMTATTNLASPAMNASGRRGANGAPTNQPI